MGELMPWALAGGGLSAVYWALADEWYQARPPRRRKGGGRHGR